MSQDPITRFVEAIAAATVPDVAGDVFTDDANLDATVPGWRFSVRGAGGIGAELGRWYADEGRFEELRRTPIAGGEVVEFTLTWVEGGVPHAAHQVHVLEVVDGRIAADRAWCGGRWPAGLLAEMETAAHAG